MVTPDEIFHFNRPIKPARVKISEIAHGSEHLKNPGHGADHRKVKEEIKAEAQDFVPVLEDSLEGGHWIHSVLKRNAVADLPE